MYAQISLVGRVTHDVELRARATTGEPYMQLGLEVNEGYKDHMSCIAEDFLLHVKFPPAQSFGFQKLLLQKGSDPFRAKKEIATEKPFFSTHRTE